MQETLAKYRERIQSGEIHPMVRWDGRTSGLIFDAARDDTPLTLMQFGALRLDGTTHRIATREREFAFVPIDARFEIRVGSQGFAGHRQGGPFAGLPETSNAFAIYVPAGADVELSGTGEMVYFTAPARGHKPPAMVAPGQRENVTRGSSVWLRRVVTLFTPDDVSTVLVGGETYSPPGLWSGTPLHVHDRDEPAAGQSDHEEVYYHVARHPSGPWGPFGVQMLFDDQGLNEAYVIHDRDAFAIPGAAHPVVAGPNTDLLYVWALAGKSTALQMFDVPEFAYLKRIGGVLDRLTATHARPALSAADFVQIAEQAGLNAEQAHVLRMHLGHQGFTIQA